MYFCEANYKSSFNQDPFDELELKTARALSRSVRVILRTVNFDLGIFPSY